MSHTKPASGTHDVLSVEETAPVPANGEHQQSPMSMQMRLNAGGLTGWPATVANMSAVGFVLVLVVLMYTDFRSSVKEERAVTREEIRMNREANDKANHNIVDALKDQNNAIERQTSSDQTKFDSLLQSQNNLIQEMRTDRQLNSQKIDMLIQEIRKTNSAKP